MNLENKTSIVFLQWLTEDNYHRRIKLVEESLNSLNKLKNYDVTIINNGGISVSSLPTINLKKNYYDVAIHFCGYQLAKLKKQEYFIYTYDDFVFFDYDFLESCEKFLDQNQEVSCLRLPSYEFRNEYFNANITPKSINPDAVRHEYGANNSNLKFDGPFIIDKKEFYKTNWRPNSRPTMWRVSSFEDYISNLDLTRVPVMQPFELHLYNTSDSLYKQQKFVSSFLNKGVCKTFDIKSSERVLIEKKINWYDVYANVEELFQELKTQIEI